MAGALKGSAVRLVMGVMADKDVEGILRAYRDGGIFPAEAVCVRPDNPRSMDPSELSRHINLVYNGKLMSKLLSHPARAENMRTDVHVQIRFRCSLQDRSICSDKSEVI